MKLLIMQLPPISRHFIPPRSKYSPQQCQIHSYKSTGRIMVLSVVVNVASALSEHFRIEANVEYMQM
jgi:hypothetical protein